MKNAQRGSSLLMNSISGKPFVEEKTVPDLKWISDPNDPQIEFFRLLKGNHPRLEQSGLILIEGEQQVERALAQTSLRIHTTFFEKEFYDRFQSSFTDRIRSAPDRFCADRQVMSQIVGYRLHQGCMLLAEQPRLVLLNEIEFPAVMLNGLTDPENVGSIARSCAAFGVRGLIFDAESSNPYIRRSIRVSMGGIFAYSVCSVDSVREAIVQLQARGIRVIAIENSPGSVPLERFSFPRSGQHVLLLGNERRGIDSDTLGICDHVVQIAMDCAIVASLNVSVAAGIALSAFYSQTTTAA